MNWPFVYSKTFEETFSYGTFQTHQINMIFWRIKHVKLPYSAIYDFKDTVSEVIKKVHLIEMFMMSSDHMQ